MIHDCWTGTGPIFAAACRLLAGDRVPVGEMRLRATNPDRVNGWLWCNGQQVDRVVYAALFAELGTAFGIGDGATTFNLPDLRDRVPVSKGTQFPGAGPKGGEVAHANTLNEMATHDHGGGTGTVSSDHTHAFSTSYESADHAHAFQVVTDAQGAHNHVPSGGGVFVTGAEPMESAGIGEGSGYSLDGATNVAGGHQHNVGGATGGRNAPHYHTGNTGGMSANHNHAIAAQGSGTPHNNMQPYQVVGGWMIKAT